MPLLGINACDDCPFHAIHREHWMDAEYGIYCTHEDQTNKSIYTRKIQFHTSIYFPCPLDKEEEDVEGDD